MLPYFRKLETDIDRDGPLHGADGPLRIGRIHEARWPGFSGAFAAAGSEGYRNLQDQNAAFEDGYFPIVACTDRDRRISAATACLTPDIRARPNLTIRPLTAVERLLFDGRKVTGVKVHTNGRAEDSHAGEVVVCAGALHSPPLLLRSGIGPAAELHALGVAAVHDLPGVGKHLMEIPASISEPP